MHPQVVTGTAAIASSDRLRHALLLVHYFLPVFIGWSLALVMRRASGLPPSFRGLVLLLAGIGAAYSFDRLIEGSPASAPRPLWLQRTLWGGFTACACVMFILLVTGKVQASMLLVCGILSSVSLLYSQLKRIPLAKTLGVAIAWIWACATLPFAGRSGVVSAWNRMDNDATLPLMLLLCAACSLCDLKDAARDRSARVPSLPVLVGPRWTCLIAMGLALASAGIAVLHHREGIAVASVLLAAVAQAPALLSHELIGPIVIDSILVVPGILIFAGVV